MTLTNRNIMRYPEPYRMVKIQHNLRHGTLSFVTQSTYNIPLCFVRMKRYLTSENKLFIEAYFLDHPVDCTIRVRLLLRVRQHEQIGAILLVMLIKKSSSAMVNYCIVLANIMMTARRHRRRTM